jgi:uncharacterized protein YjbI with pentapeptide repeats
VTRSFTILTTRPNADVAELRDRMPVVLEQQDWPLRLGGAEGDHAACWSRSGWVERWEELRQASFARLLGRQCSGYVRPTQRGGSQVANEETKPKRKAKDNRWYRLATLHGEPSSSDDEIARRNRITWNRCMAARISDELRTALRETGWAEDELTPLSEDELRCIEAKAGSLEADEIDFSEVELGTPFFAHRFIFLLTDFRNAVFSELAYFHSAVFSGNADFSSAQFKGNAFFDQAVFSDNAYFSRAGFTFAGFSSASFRGNTYFDDVYFNWVHFSGAVFSDAAAFVSTTFDRADFGSAAFSDIANFLGAAFGHADFGTAAFSGKTDFGATVFSGNADFTHAAFSDTASFSHAKFRANADFTHAAFSDTASFYDTVFSGNADFTHAAFSDTAFFSHAEFSDNADFSSAQFKGNAEFGYVSFGGHADFGYTVFGSIAEFGSTVFRGAATFVNGEMRNVTSFANVKFARPPAIFGASLHEGTTWRDVTWPAPPADPEQAGEYVECYERLKLEMDRLKKYSDESDFLAYELQSRRVLVGFWGGLHIAVYGSLSDYGRSYTRPLLLLAVTMLVGIPFSAIHLVGFWTPLLADLPHMRQAIGVSFANTFGLFGRPLMKPEILLDLPDWLKAVGTIQSILGIVLLFLFGMGIRNRFRMK